MKFLVVRRRLILILSSMLLGMVIVLIVSNAKQQHRAMYQRKELQIRHLYHEQRSVGLKADKMGFCVISHGFPLSLCSLKRGNAFTLSLLYLCVFSLPILSSCPSSQSLLMARLKQHLRAAEEEKDATLYENKSVSKNGTNYPRFCICLAAFFHV